MDSEFFKPYVQYGDWKGACKADNADRNKLSKWLKDNKHEKEGQSLIGISFNLAESFSESPESYGAFVDFIFATKEEREKINSSQDPVEVREVSVKMKPDEFFGFFKRFSITIAHGGIEFEGREYIPIEQATD